MKRQSDNSNERIEFILLSRGEGCQVWKLQIHALKLFLKKKQNPKIKLILEFQQLYKNY